ncbi:MAG: hypothetical protein ABW199_07275, partial [Caulobacterales bacterium]
MEQQTASALSFDGRFTTDNPLYAKADSIPDHVPPERVFDFDMYFDPSPGGDFATTRLDIRRAGTPRIFWTPHNGGHWVATRGKEIDAIINNAEVFGN